MNIAFSAIGQMIAHNFLLSGLLVLIGAIGWIGYFFSHRFSNVSSIAPEVPPGFVSLNVFKAVVFMHGEKMDAEHREIMKKTAWAKAKHRLPGNPEAQQKFAENWIAEQTKILDEHKLKASDYFIKK